MRSTVTAATLVTCVLLFAGCAYVGDPLYPALNIAIPIRDLAAVERGEKIVIAFTIPALTTEGLAVKQIGSIELRVGPNTESSFDVNHWASSATRVDVALPGKPGPVNADVDVKGFVGQEVIIAVRAGNSKGRMSEWSNLITLKVEPPVATPANLTKEVIDGGVRLRWSAPGATKFRIYRRAGNETQPTVIGTSDKEEYIDTTAEYLKPYEYSVQSLRGDMESDLAGPVTVTPKDEFAPAVPVGLTASLGVNSIELAWERNTERDFKAYRVYRAVGDGPFEKVADMIETPTYSDKKIESGKRYRYAVSAVDLLGNESEKSAPVEAAAP